MDDAAEVIAREFFASWRDMTGDGFAAFFSDDGVHLDRPLGEHRGRDAIRAAAEEFPPTDVELKTVVSANGTVMVERVDRFDLRGVSVELPVAGVLEIDEDGRIRRFTDYYDLKSIVDQLEAADSPASS
jgi:limonene-1,2-epoxide hydrolase